MGRRGVTREAVESVHDALVAAGLTPSVRTVREKLGDTGSLTTIAEHLRAIHLERQEAPGPALPDPLVRKLVEGASDFWRDLSDAADQSVEGIRRSAATDIAAALTERDQAFEQATRAQEELGARRATLDTLERHLAETASRLERAETDLSASRVAQETAGKRVQAYRDKRNVLERELVAEREGAARRETQWQNEHTALDARIDRLEHALDAAEQALDAARAAHDNEREELNARVSERETRRAETATVLARTEERAASLANTLEERSGERDDSRKEASALRTRLQAVTEARDVLEAERAASAREASTAALLERLVDDDRTGRVLALLESIDARVSAAEADDHHRHHDDSEEN